MTMPGQPERAGRPTDALLTALYDRLSHRIAGGQRTQAGVFGMETVDEGFLPDEYRTELPDDDWFDPTQWANADPNNMAGFDLSNIPSGGPVREGKGMDFFRAGEAPNNHANRNNPLYQKRRDFAVAINSKIREMFGVSDHGSAGYYRPYDPAHAAPGGPSGNSDHYSAGAADYFGSSEELTRLRNWLINQPFVSFVRWQSESHYDHLHVSYDLGWVAQNFGGQMPAFAEEPTAQAAPDAPDLPTPPPSDDLAIRPV